MVMNYDVMVISGYGVQAGWSLEHLGLPFCGRENQLRGSFVTTQPSWTMPRRYDVWYLKQTSLPL